MPSRNGRLKAATLAHRRWLLRFEGGAVREAIEAYDEDTKIIAAKLQILHERLKEGKPLTARQQRQAEKLQRQLANRLRSARDAVRSKLQGRLESVLDTEVRMSASRLGAVLPGPVGVRRIPVEELHTLLRDPVGAQPWTQRLDASMLGIIDRVDAGLFAAIHSGAGIHRATKLMEQAVGEIEGGRHRLKRLARTEIQRVANTTADRIYRANRDVLKGVRYLATLDARGCALCRPHHNKVFLFDEDGNHDAPEIPRHPNCRCFLSPVSKPLSEIVSQAAA